MAHMGEERNVYRILVEKCKGKSPLGKHRHTGDYNIKMDVKEIQGGSNMTGTNCDLFTHNQSRSYLNHLV